MITRLFRSMPAVGLVVTLTAAACGTVGPAQPPDSVPGPSATATPAPGPTYPADVLDRPKFSDLERGTYFVRPESTSIRVFYDVATEGWKSWIGTFKPELGREYRFVALTIVNVTNVVRDGCSDHRPAAPPVGESVQDLATALAALPPFVLSQAPSDVTAFGYQGLSLEYTVPDIPVQFLAQTTQFTECTGRQLMSWIGAPIDPAFYGHHVPGEKYQLWILDVEGQRLLIQASWAPDAPPEDVAELRAILASIRIET